MQYHTEIPNGKWSGEHKGFPTPPAIGTQIRVTMNRLGTGTVDRYFVQDGWIGILVTPDEGQRPDWHIKQNAGKEFLGYHVFGAEIAPLAALPVS